MTRVMTKLSTVFLSKQLFILFRVGNATSHEALGCVSSAVMGNCNFEKLIKLQLQLLDFHQLLFVKSN